MLNVTVTFSLDSFGIDIADTRGDGGADVLGEGGADVLGEGAADGVADPFGVIKYCALER